MNQQPPIIRDITQVIQTSFQSFFRSSAAGGIVILAATAIALIWVNSPFGSSYTSIVHDHGSVHFFGVHVSFTFEQFVNDGLMVIFFLMVGLEIKREMLIGELSTTRKATLPMVAAAFGMIVPGAIFAALNMGGPDIRGWGVPVATDIAFALGILALLGDQVPIGLKVFLAALAIVDDLLAVLIIAIFYTAELNVLALSAAGIILALLYGGNRIGIQSVRFYGFLGFFLWVAVVYSGIHATIAGVLLALTIPADAKLNAKDFTDRARSLIDRIARKTETDEEEGHQMDYVNALEDISEAVQSPLARMEHGLSAPVSFIILPIFALVNAGVRFDPSVISEMFSPLALGIMLGLFVGKQVGVTASVWLSVKLGIAELPRNVNMRLIYGVAALCGIGFTMALFVANLAFDSPESLGIAKLSVIIGSTLSALIGSIALKIWLPKKEVSAA